MNKPFSGNLNRVSGPGVEWGKRKLTSIHHPPGDPAFIVSFPNQSIVVQWATESFELPQPTG
jgi:hypothetical protein